MAKTLSEDLRRRVIAAVILGAIEAHLAQRLVEHQTQRRRQDGDGNQPRDPTLMLQGRPTPPRNTDSVPERGWN